MFIEMIGETQEYITDVLVKSLQGNINKDTLWKLFGDVIYKNLERNLEGTKLCNVCGEWLEIPIESKSERCDKCQHEYRKEWNRQRMREKRNK